MDNEERMDKAKNDVLMVFFYIGKLVEGGFVADGPKVTVTGFDIAMDLKEAGWVVGRETVQNTCEVYNCHPVEGFTELIMRVQEKGLPAMIESANKRNREN